jgi:hypothetical protein
MFLRKIALLLLGIFVIAIYFSIKSYRVWLNERVLVFLQEVYDQTEKETYEERREYRLGVEYKLCKFIETSVKKTDKKKVLLLMPSDEYIKKNGQGLTLPEPVVFYYYTGLKSTRPGNADELKANYFVILDGRGAQVGELKDTSHTKEVLNFYKSNI